MPGSKAHIVHDPEPIATQLPLLGRPEPIARSPPLEAMGGAAGRAILHREVTAGDVEDRVHVQIAVGAPQLAKRDLLGVAKQPSRLMIKGGRSLLELADSQQHVEAAALGTESVTRRRYLSAGLASMGPGCQIAAST